MKKNSLCVCVCPFASGSKKHFFRKTDFPAPDAKKSVFRVNKRFSEKIRLLRNPPEGGGMVGVKRTFFFKKPIFLLRMAKKVFQSE